MATTPDILPAPTRRRLPRSLRVLLVAVALGLLVAVAGLFSLRAGDERVPPPVATGTGVPVRAGGDALSAVTGTAKALGELQARVAARPDDPEARALLGVAYLQRARETSDPSFYTKADTLFGQALALDPNEFDAILGQGSLALSRHEFATALTLGERALTLSQGGSQSALAIVGDAQVELGRYPQAFADLRPAARSAPEPGRLRTPVLRLRAPGRARAGHRSHAPGRRRRRGQPREHAVDAHPARPPAAAPGADRRRRGRVPPRARDHPELRARRGRPRRRRRRPWRSRGRRDLVHAGGHAPAAGGDRDRPRRRPERAWRGRGGRGRLRPGARRWRRSSRRPAATTTSSSRCSTPTTPPPAPISQPWSNRPARAVAERPSVVAHDALGWALFKAGRLRRGAARSAGGDRARHGRSAARSTTSARSRTAPATGPRRTLRSRRALWPRTRASTPSTRPPRSRSSIASGGRDAPPRHLARRPRHRPGGRARRRRASARQLHRQPVLRIEVGAHAVRIAQRARPGGDPDLPGAQPRRRRRRRRALARGGRGGARQPGRRPPPAAGADRSNGAPATLAVESAELAFVAGQGGLQTTRLDLLLRADGAELATAPATIEFTNTYAGDRIGWREIVVAHEPGTAVLSTTAATVDRTDGLRSYPQELLESPPDQRSATVDARRATAASPSRACAPTATWRRCRRAVGRSLRLAHRR